MATKTFTAHCGTPLWYSTNDYGPGDGLYCGTCDTYHTIPYGKPTSSSYRTQKVKGLYALGGLLGLTGESLSYCSGPKIAAPRAVVQDEEGLENAKVYFSHGIGPFFARPCPVTPRHGFVDSRVVKSPEELEQVWKETLAADPQGEMMLMNFIPADYNFVVTPSMITFGLGHDGATAGKDTLNLPVMPMKMFSEEADLGKAGIGLDQDYYIEGVAKFNDLIHLTQLRAGPKSEKLRADFIPTTTHVKVVLVPNGMDLLEWEKLIITMKETEGVVVNNIGGSPIDHYSVHARSFNIPVITTREVVVGETLEPIPTTPMSVESVLSGVVAGMKYDLPGKGSDSDCYHYRRAWERAINFSLFALHNSGAFEGEDGFWLGVGVSMLLRFGVTALKGEARHIKHPMPNREVVYDKALHQDLFQLRASTPRNIHVLRYGAFGSSGVGGEKWALCGAAAVKLFNALGRLAKEKTQESLGELLRAYNDTINQAHNGGWWLNKFTSHSSFTYACLNQGKYVMQVAPFALEVRERGKVDKELEETLIKRIASWRPLAPLPAVTLLTSKVSFGFSSVGGLFLSVEDKVLRDKRKPLTIEDEELVNLMLKTVNSSLVCRQTSQGTALLAMVGGEEKVIYNDPPLEGSALTK